MENWRGKWAVLTGASAGIGLAFAAELAAGGTNLVLTARRRERLEELASELTGKHAIKTEICVADLAQPSGPDEIFAFTQGKGIDVDLLINNAGFGVYGEFRKSANSTRQLEMVQVNIAAVVHLTSFVFAENGYAPQGRHFDSCINRRVSSRAVSHYVCRHKIIRSALRRRSG